MSAVEELVRRSSSPTSGPFEPPAVPPDLQSDVDSRLEDAQALLTSSSDASASLTETSEMPVAELPVPRSSPPASDPLEPVTTHPDSQPTVDSLGDALAPLLPDSSEATPTPSRTPEPVPPDFDTQSIGREKASQSPSSLRPVEEVCELPIATGADDDSQAEPAAACESSTSPSTSQPRSPGLLSMSPPEDTLELPAELLAASEETGAQAMSPPPSQQSPPQSQHDVDDNNIETDLFDLDALELEYPSDDEMDAPEASLSTSNGTPHAGDGEGPTALEVPAPSRPVSTAADPVRLCHDPLPPDHPVSEFLDDIDADQPPPAHFARAFVGLGYDTDSLLDMLACAKPECGDWDALQAELRIDKKYDAWWLRVKMALRERAARCLRKSRIFTRSSSA